MVLVRTAELKNVSSLKKLPLQLVYQTDTKSLKQHINEVLENFNVLVAEL